MAALPEDPAAPSALLSQLTLVLGNLSKCDEVGPAQQPDLKTRVCLFLWLAFYWVGGKVGTTSVGTNLAVTSTNEKGHRHRGLR